MIKTVDNKELVSELATRAVECQVPVQIEGVYVSFDVREFPEFVHIYFLALATLSKVWTWGEVSAKVFFRIVESGTRFWLRIEGRNEVRAGRVD